MSMTDDEKKRFEEANRYVHHVETEWHYETMIKYGYVPITKEGIGFVRSYEYEHPVTHHKMRICTGAHADYFNDDVYAITGHGFWADLEPHLKKIQELTHV